MGHPSTLGLPSTSLRPNSYTGEDVLELQGHGGSAVLGQVLARCLELGARLAQPGEFTRRAFLNGKLDLAQAESVADLIDASSERAARSAMRSLKGEFSRQIQRLAAGLIELRAWAEAGIDFPEEEIDPLAEETALAQLRDLTESDKEDQGGSDLGKSPPRGSACGADRPAKCREVESPEQIGGRRNRDRDGGSRHNPRCDSAASRDGWSPDSYRGHGGSASDQ